MTEKDIQFREPSLINLVDNAVDGLVDNDTLESLPDISENEYKGRVLHHSREKIGEETYDFHILYMQSEQNPNKGEIQFLLGNEYASIASITFDNSLRSSEDEYVSEHRLVSPEKRKTGIGSLLLKTAEDFFRRLADRKQKEILLSMPMAQAPLMKGAIKQDYLPRGENIQLVQEILGEFDSGNKSGKYIFLNDTGRGMIDRIGIVFRKKDLEREGIDVQQFKTAPPDKKTIEKLKKIAVFIDFSKTIKPSHQ